jgi:hypothetical protein
MSDAAVTQARRVEVGGDVGFTVIRDHKGCSASLQQALEHPAFPVVYIEAIARSFMFHDDTLLPRVPIKSMCRVRGHSGCS